MAGNRRTRRSTSVEPANSQQPVIRRSLRTRQDSNKENTPPKNSNTQIEENENEKVPTTAQQEVCGICLDTVNVDKGGLPVCVHTFCFDCIHQWSKTSNTCPMCKAKFKMINRTESLTSKPKRVKVSDVDQRPDYSDPDPDDFLSDEEDSGDDLIYFGEDILLDLVGDAWMDIDDGEFLGTDDDDEEDDGLEAELIDEDELAEAEESEEEEDEATSWESHLANANTYDRGEEGQDSDYDDESDDCIIIDAPASRTRARGSRASSRSSNNVIMINIHDSDDDEEDEDGDDESEDGVGLRRSRRLQNSRQRRVTTLVLNFDELSDASNDFGSSESDEQEGEEEIQEEEEGEEEEEEEHEEEEIQEEEEGEEEEEEEHEEEEEEVRRTITTRSRSYPSAFSANNDIVTPRVTRSSSRTRDRASSDIINEITPPRLTRSQSRNRSFNNNNNNNNTPVTRTRRRRVHSNNHIEEEDEDDERKGKRVRKSPSRFGFDYGTKESPATPTTTTTTTTTTSTWRDTPEDEDETMEGESRYNLRRSRRNM